MSSIDYINTLAARGIELWAQDGKLQYKAPKEAITPALLAELKQHKAALVPLLEQFAGTAGSAPLSYSQKSLWSLHQIHPGSAAYNVTYAARLVDTLDIDALARCVDYLVARHPILRTRYAVVDGQPVQQVQTAASARLTVARVFDASLDAMRDWVEDEANKPFDLTASPIRLKLLVNEARGAGQPGPKHVLLLNVHHIAADFRSLEILVRELRSLYAMALAQQPLKLAPPGLQYKDCVQHEIERLQGPQADALLAFWQRELQGPLPTLALPTDHPRPALKTENGRVFSRPFGAALSRAVRERARALQVTPYMLLLGVYQLFLFHHTGQPRLWIGAPTAGRGQPGSEAVLGHFVNTVVLACELQPQESFARLLETTRAMMARVLDHADYPFPLLVEKLRPARDTSRSPLFQAMYNWNQVRAGAGPGEDGSDALFVDTVLASSTGTRGATHDLTLNVQDDGTHYVAAWTFNTDLFEAATVERFAAQYAGLVEQVLADAQQALHGYHTAAPAARLRTLQGLARDMQGPEAGATLPQAVVALAARQPQRKVWRIGGRDWRAGELLAAAMVLAERLAAAGVGASHTVALDTGSAPEHALAVLAVLMQGARLASQADSAADAVLHGEAGPWGRCAPGQLQLRGARPGTAAALSPQALATWIEGAAELMALAPTRSAFLPEGTPPALCCAALLMGLACTAREVVVPEGQSLQALADDDAAAAAWHEALAAAPGAVLVLPDLLVPRLHSAAPHATGLHTVLAYGEHPHALAAACAPHARAAAPTHWRFLPAALLAAWSPVAFAAPTEGGWPLLLPTSGRPVPLVLGPCDDLADAGQHGRLHLLEDAAEAPDAALHARFAHQPDLRHALAPYRITATPLHVRIHAHPEGDAIVSPSPSTLRFEGRAGPVEIAALEELLAAQPEVAEAAGAVRVAPGAETASLVVALRLREGQAPDATLAELRRRLKRALPEAWQPDALLAVARLPLDAQGRLNVEQLPQAVPAEGGPRAAQGEIEHQLAALWREVLSLPDVGVDDDFFALGGDSILAAVIVARASALGLYLRPRDLFEHTTIAGLATVVSLAPHVVAEQGPVRGEAPPSPASAWFLEQVDTDRSHFNQALLIALREAPDAALMQQALRAVAAQHDTLGSRFVHDPARGWRQHFGAEAAEAPPSYREVECLDEHGLCCDVRWREAIDAAQASLDIEHGPLWALRWLAGPTLAESRLLIVVHHLAIDGISWSVLLQDLGDCYQRLRAGAAVQLPAKTTSAKAWAEQWAARLDGDTLDSDRRYWQARAGRVQHTVDGGRVALMRCGRQRTRPGERPQADHIHRPPPEGIQQSGKATFAGSLPDACALTLDRDTTQALRSRAHQAYGTDVNDLLLAALHAGFHAWSGATALLVDVEGHGRDALGESADLTRSVGWFTSLYPVLLEAPAFDPPALIKHVKQQLREVPARGASFGVLRHLAPAGDATRQALAALPESPVLFTYLGALEQMVPGGGLFSGPVEPAPGSRSPRQRLTHLLDMWAYIANGCLTLECSFEGGAAAEESIGCLMQRIEQALVSLVRHCESDEAGGIVPADVPDLGLDQAGLDALLDEVAALEQT